MHRGRRNAGDYSAGVTRAPRGIGDEGIRAFSAQAPNMKTRIGAGLLAAVCWFALALQFALIVRTALRDGTALGSEIARFFSYFTILTNVLVAVYATTAAVAARSRAGRWFARPGVAGAVTAYIVFVGISYELLLRRTWNPQGWQRVADTLLHDATPLLGLAYWTVCIPHRMLRWRKLGWWLLYPCSYAAYAMARGAATGIYPYDFLDPATAGMHGSVAALAGLCIGIVAVCAAVFAFDRFLPNRGAL